MLNIRPDVFWPWYYPSRQADENPPGFRMAAAGSVLNARPGGFGSMFPGYDSEANASAPPGIGPGFAKPPARGSGSPFDFLDRPNPMGPHVTGHSLWFGLHGEPDASVPGFRFQPPRNEAPGLRIGANGSVRDDPPDDIGLTSFAYESASHPRAIHQ